MTAIAVTVTVTATVAITFTNTAIISCRPLLLLLLPVGMSLGLWCRGGIGERTDPMHVFEFGGRYPL